MNYPEMRTAKPLPRAWQLANYIPAVQVMARSIRIGFMCQPAVGCWNPIMRHECIKVNSLGIHIITKRGLRTIFPSKKLREQRKTYSGVKHA